MTRGGIYKSGSKLMSHETYSFGQYTGIVEDNYNQQLTFDFGDKRKIKETVTSYYEETDSEGKRRIHKETKETKWFDHKKVVDTTQLFRIIQSIYDTCIFDITYCTCNLWGCRTTIVL